MTENYSVNYRFTNLDTLVRHLNEVDYIFKGNKGYSHNHQVYIGAGVYIVRHNFINI